MQIVHRIFTDHTVEWLQICSGGKMSGRKMGWTQGVNIEDWSS